MATVPQFELHRPQNCYTFLGFFSLLSSLSLSSVLKKMAMRRPNISSSAFPPASNNGEAELDSLSNSELIFFLESSFRRSEFIRVADILKSREELAKSEALRDLSAKLSHLEAKNYSLEKELRALRNDEAVGKLEKEIMKEKGRYLFLKGSYEKMEKLAQEKIKILMEEVEKERANCSRLEEQLKLEKTRNERTTEIDSWKNKYSLLEAWILRFLDTNPHLIEKLRKEQDVNGEKQNMDFFRINKAAGILLRSNATSDKKESFLAARAKSKSVVDINGSDIGIVGDSFEDNSSVMKCSFGNSDKNYRERKFQISQTSGVKGVLEFGDEDDVVCISELMFQRSAKGIK